MAALDGPQFPHLFTPLQIGPARLANRIVSSGHDTVMAVDGEVGDQLVAYHEARAAGGVGLIVVQVAGVHPTAKYTDAVLMADTDACIPGYQALMAAVAPYGTVVFGQIFHDGRELMESEDGTLPVALAPSAVPNERFHVMPRAMSVEQIEEMVDCYAAAAHRLMRAGLHGVEVVASHGYLPAQFLNPQVNLRTDGYGGSLEGRLRFLREVLAAVRARVGTAIAVGVRVSADERSADQMDPAEMERALALLDGDGQLDYVSVVAGSSSTLAGSDHIVPPMSFAPAYTAPLAARVKAVVSVPVLVAGRVNQPQEAEAVLAAGQADAVVMTRALIADPDLPVKAASGRAEDIRACIGCNQACIGHFHAGYPISCIQFPETGREREYRTKAPASPPRRVLVVGGGPAGLKAAAVAAQRGHHVSVYEAARHLGGQVLLAQLLPGRAEFGGAATNLVAEAERAGAKLVTGVTVDAAMVEELDPDVVVVATGARPRWPQLERGDGATVVDVWELLGGSLPAGRVVVADWRCDWLGLGAAILLAEAGRRVTLAVSGYHAGQRIQQYVRDEMVARATRRGVSIVPLVRPVGVDDDTVYLQHVLTGEPVLLDADALVLSQGHLPVDELLAELATTGREVHAVGDCLAPRTVEEAVLEGLRVGAAL